MTTLTYDKALELLQRAVDEKGADYVYPRAVDAVTGVSIGGCVNYDEDGTPSCIVGHVLNYLGADGYSADVASWEAFDQAGIRLTKDAGKLLEKAQTHQDRGVPWGLAVGDARITVEAYPS